MMATGTTRRIGVLFVCTGNICRSPTAEAIFRHYVQQAQAEDRIVIDSAGTGDYHIGEPPDERAQRVAAARGYDLAGLRARQIALRDFEHYDYVLAMDEHNLATLRRWCPVQHSYKLELLGAYCNGEMNGCIVPDPYDGALEDFERVIELVEDAAPRLLRHILDRPV